MRWVKKGRIYTLSALQPTPWVRPDGEIRIFAGFRDSKGVSRVGYIDVSSHNPANILHVANRPVLDVGAPGAFDDNGVVPCAIVARDGVLYLYYAGYQLGHHVRFTAYSGLAISRDSGQSFLRYQKTPILERTEDELLFRAIHSIRYEKGVWRVWYGAGSHFMASKEKSLPVYDIRYMESTDGIHFPATGKTVIALKQNEYRVGRPYVIKTTNGYQMYFGYSTDNIPYRLTYAVSADGIHWRRKNIGLRYTKGDFDSDMSAYPAVVSTRGHTYLFYNGNEYGKMGIGYAIQTPGSGN